MYMQKTVICDENYPEIGQSYGSLILKKIPKWQIKNKIITALKYSRVI